jgi:hypothetical protein
VTATLSISEKAWQATVLDAARRMGWRVAHFRTARTMSGGWSTPVHADGAGFPDLCLVRERVIFAELKAENGRLSQAQADWLGALGSAGADVHVWRPSDWDIVEATLGGRR